MSDIKDIKLAKEGKERILWAEQDMPVLGLIKEQFVDNKPFKGLKMGLCLHVTAETANLARTLKEGGAEIYLCASNPLSTQDDVAASLTKDFGIDVYAIKGEDSDTYYSHIESVLSKEPNVTLDDGADLISVIHKKHKKLIKNIKASMEETTTGVIRLRSMQEAGELKIPVIAVNDADAKHLFDNRYGTGQSTIDGIIRATDKLLAGKNFVVLGYGWCGKGLALRARGIGSNVIVTEVDPVKALEAVMDGFRVMKGTEAAKVGDIFCTVTGDINVIDVEHFQNMKDGAIVCNSGHFDVEINIKGLKKIAKSVKTAKDFVEEYTLKNGKRIYLLAEGRLINLASAHGHPASVMDMSFSVQALSAEFAVLGKTMLPGVYDVPKEIDERIASLKLKSMDIEIDKLTKEQIKYLKSWQEGT
ncbi:MAG: adenosylhomocysteinase [bacterium]|jgi:adenosylhomocysteinase|uniref:Adenosylhomocysteinase n=1 Tax=Candidatus Acidulodesulfobacterium acidiphilum TaxID=2597224 RepID=A0A520X8T2_9DELT|nr:MAG: adenosylhomocysteinase [Candidatus Acidulodesulfobacterium acidiphilum]